MLVLIFVIATTSIVLYDMYINIEIVEENPYNAGKISREVSTRK